MAKRRPLKRLSSEEKIKRLVGQDRDRGNSMAGRALALSMMGTEHGADPAKIEMRARQIARMRALALEESKKALGVKEEKATTADLKNVKPHTLKRGYDDREFRISPGYFRNLGYDI